MLLRHASKKIKNLLACGASVDEYTAIQPPDSKYDFWHRNKRKAQLVVVIVYDRVYGVFEISGESRVSKEFSIASPEYVRFKNKTKDPERDVKKFHLSRIHSRAENSTISGWESRSLTPVQRFDGGFFKEILISEISPAKSVDDFYADLSLAVDEAREFDEETLQMRAEISGHALPEKVLVTASVYQRNPSVVALVLRRASGICEACGKPAPFKTRAGHWYLEVHHKKPLAKGGMDTLENTEALCPNCHREKHYA